MATQCSVSIVYDTTPPTQCSTHRDQHAMLFPFLIGDHSINTDDCAFIPECLSYVPKQIETCTNLLFINALSALELRMCVDDASICACPDDILDAPMSRL